MSDIYSKLEGMQKDYAVSRSARPITSHGVTKVIHCNHIEAIESAYLLKLWLIGRPETQKEILKLCADCTKTDVALNNLVARARIGLTNDTRGKSGVPKPNGAHQANRPRTIKAPTVPRNGGANPSKPSKPSAAKSAAKRKATSSKRKTAESK